MFPLRIVFAFVALLGAQLISASGQAATLYVTANGSGNTCTQFDPCGNLLGTILLAHIGDTIVCLTSPPPAAFTIDRSITIDCSAAPATTSGGGTANTADGLGAQITINIPAGNPSDPLRVVRLRGFTIDGAWSNTPSGRIAGRGIDIQAAGEVYIENTVISNTSKQGILDHRFGGQTKLFVKDTIITGNAGAGIVAISEAVGITVLDNVTSTKNTYGIAVGTGNNVIIKNSVFSGNSTAGVEGDAGSHVVVSNSTISHNNIGVQSSTSVRLYNNDISFNNTVFSGPAATMGLNRFSSNVSQGTALGIVPNAPADIGP